MGDRSFNGGVRPAPRSTSTHPQQRTRPLEQRSTSGTMMEILAERTENPTGSGLYTRAANPREFLR